MLQTHSKSMTDQMSFAVEVDQMSFAVEVGNMLSRKPKYLGYEPRGYSKQTKLVWRPYGGRY